MDFWRTVVANIISGGSVALFAALLAWLIAGRYAANRQREQATQDRNLAAAEELYAVHGQFFAVWKAWEQHKKLAPEYALVSADVPTLNPRVRGSGPWRRTSFEQRV